MNKHSISLRNCSTAWCLSAFADEAGDSADKQIQALGRAGLHFIDLRGVEGHNISALPDDLARIIRGKLDAAGIRVNMFGSPLGKIDIIDDVQIDLDKLRHLGRMAEIFSCKAVRVFSYYNKNKLAKAKWRSEALDRLRRLRDLAEELGLMLYMENERHIFGDLCDDVVDVAAQLRQPGLFGLIFDFDNYNQSGEDVWQNWLRLRDITDAFHLKDSDKDHQHVPIGQGAGRAREILADALARGWKGCLSLEPHLQHSAAVMATGPGGRANQKFAEMEPADCFHAAAGAAVQLLGQIKAPGSVKITIRRFKQPGRAGTGSTSGKRAVLL